MSTIISIHGYDIHYIDDEPTIQDLDLAKRLGYERPRAIRDLIKRLLREKKLNEINICRTVEQTPGESGRPSEVFYLDEFASLKVTVKSEAAKADEITDEIIQVFIDARKGVKPADSSSQYVYDVEFQVAEVAARMLRMSDTSKIRMLASICEIKGVPSTFLPAYVDEPQVRAMTALLKEHGSSLSAKAANLALLDMGFLEELERKGSKGDIKRFKSLTEKGVRYGRNETSPQNPRETQPLYFVDRFPELLGLIETHLGKNKAA